MSDPMAEIIVDGYTLGDLYRFSRDGLAEAECDYCGYFAEVEPDADYACPACREGQLTSPLVKAGYL